MTSYLIETEVVLTVCKYFLLTCTAKLATKHKQNRQTCVGDRIICSGAPGFFLSLSNRMLYIHHNVTTPNNALDMF